MPQAPREEPVSSLLDFTRMIEERMTASGCPLWYRGCGKSSHELKPTLFRHPDNKDTEKLIALESDILARFKERSVPYQERPLANDWEYLFLMQHFRVPTRLLDWTENPYIALYFAATSSPFLVKGGKLEFEGDAALWILEPVPWNRRALQHIGFKGGILSSSSEFLKSYQPAQDYEYLNSEPVALYGIHNSPRIVAQRGVFTIFGKNSSPMETIYREHDFPADCLIKLVLPKNSLPNLLASVVSIGYADSVVFPDLEGLAKEIRRFFGFWV
jgi:hypothetical protein